jgi:hypothetical protein
VLRQPGLVVQYDLDTHVQRIVRREADTGLGTFGALGAAGETGVYWVLGSKGAARAGPGPASWTEYQFSSLGLKNAQSPYPGDDGSLYVVATRIADESKVLARVDSGGWKVLYRSDLALIRGWPGTAGTLWLEDPNGLHHALGDSVATLDRKEVLSGLIGTVATQPGGIVWVYTTLGVARYSPPLWRTPPEVAHIQSPIQAAYEDPDGTLWFLSGTGISRLRGEEWKEYRFPPEWRSITAADSHCGEPRGSAGVRPAPPRFP